MRGGAPATPTWLALGLGLALASCGPSEPEPKLVSELQPGMWVEGSASFSREDHLVEILAHQGYVYAANSNEGLGVLRLEPEGGLTVTSSALLPYGELRCTSLALHAASSTLFCASDIPSNRLPDIPRIERFDLSDPAEPVLLEPFLIEQPSVRDIVVRGDTLLIHQFDDGLWSASVDPSGELGGLERLEIEGNVRSSVLVGDRVVTLVSDPQGPGTQLRLYGVEGSQWIELDRLELAGPPISISAAAEGPDSSRVAVALGSAGMAEVALSSEGLSLTRSFTPPAVVTHALLGEDLAIAITYSGAFAWDTSTDEPRMFGFGPEGTQGDRRNGNMLHGLLHEGELIASDWTWIQRWGLDPSGEILALDLPRGLYVPTDGPVEWPLRNTGTVRLRAEIWYQRQHLLDVEVEPESVTMVELPADLRAELSAVTSKVQLGIRVHDPSVASEGTPVSTSAFMIVQRQPDDPYPPAVGDVFPDVEFVDQERELFSLPYPEGSQTIWFEIDCALMWAQLEDIAWMERAGVDLGRGKPVILSDTDLVFNGFDRRWSLDGVALGLWGLAALPELADANAAFPGELYDSFFVPDIPADGAIMDYVVGPDRKVRSIERMYRGAWTLAGVEAGKLD